MERYMVEQVIRKILEKKFGISEKDTLDANEVISIGDSLDYVEMTLFLEQEFGILHIPDGKIDKHNSSIRHMTNIVIEYMAPLQTSAKKD